MKAAFRTLLYQLFALFLVLPTAFAEEQPLPDVPLFSQAELDQMLAPVALYPDQLLSQLLMAATYPLEVVQAARWARANPGLKGEAAVRAVDREPWDPSVKAMVAFPEILEQMDADLDWTQRLGNGFLAQQTQVMDSVQALRRRAESAGNLRSNEQVEVLQQGPTIVVHQVQPQVVYVPYYDPYVVYGNWWWPAYQPVRWAPWPGYYPRYGYTGFRWGPGIFVGHGFFCSDYDWRHRYVRVVARPPFYYHRPPPPQYRWVHDNQHRHGVPYRGLQVQRQYAGRYARPSRLEYAGRPYRTNQEQDAHRGERRDRVEDGRDGQRYPTGRGQEADRADQRSRANFDPGADRSGPGRTDLERTVDREVQANRITGADDRGRAGARQPRSSPDRARESAPDNRAQRTLQRPSRARQDLADVADSRNRARPGEAGAAREVQLRRDPQPGINAVPATQPVATPQRTRPNADPRVAEIAPRSGSAFAAPGRWAPTYPGASQGFAPQTPVSRPDSQLRVERSGSPRSDMPARQSTDRGGQRQQSRLLRD